MDGAGQRVRDQLVGVAGSENSVSNHSRGSDVSRRLLEPGTDTMPKRKIKVLALSSGGGHWVQLLRLRPAFDGCDITYATTRKSYRDEIDNGRFRTIPDCNRSHKIRTMWCALAVGCLLVRI